MKLFFTSLLLLFLADKVIGQTTIYVDSSVSFAGSGTAWITAYKTLSGALQTVNANPATKFLIRIAKGTYYPTGVQSATNRDSAFLILRGGVTVEGGYPSGGGVRNITLHRTVLSGNIGQASDSADNCYHVMVILGGGTLDSVLLSGLTMAYGQADSPATSYGLINSVYFSKGGGGGLIAQGINGNLIISNCVFQHNVATMYGAGAWIRNFTSSKVNVRNSVFDHNQLCGAFSIGGGLYLASWGGWDTVLSCAFTGNTAVQQTGGNSTGAGCACYLSPMINQPSGCFVDSSVFSDNSSRQCGGLELIAGTIGSSGSVVTLVSNSTFVNNNTLITGGLMYWGVSGNPKLNSAKVRNCAFIGNTGGGFATTLATIDSAAPPMLEISACSAIGNYGWYGAGISCNNDSGLIAIHSVLDSGNYAMTDGAGIYTQGPVSLDSVRIVNNTAAGSGGGLMAFADSGIVSHCIISGNVATNGGGVYNFASSPDFRNCLISGNRASLYGGAIYNANSSRPKIINCTLASDSALNGKGLYNISSSTPTVLNSIIWEGPAPIKDTNSAASVVTYSTVSGGYIGIGNKSANPLFLSALSSSAAPTIAGNYRLLPCSPAVNAGLNSGSYSGVKDLDGNPRLYGLAVDMGAYEVQTSYPAPIIGADSVCSGSAIQLSTTATGGTWSSSNNSVATVGNAGLVTGISAGTDTITYNNLSSLCPSLTRKVITVNPLPSIPAISGVSTMCVGNAVLFTNSAGGGIWGSSDTSVASISGGTVTAVGAGIDTISYTIVNSFGCSNAAMKDVTVLPVYSVTYADSVCQGTPYMFANVALTASGTYTNHFTAATGCDSAVRLVLIVKPLDLSVTQKGAVLSSNQAGATYQWIICGDNVPVTGATSQTFMALSNSSYAVIVSYNGCTDTSACSQVTGVSVTGNQLHGLKLFPNPATNTLYLSNNGPDAIDISLSDIAGMPLDHYRIAPSVSTFRIDVSGLASGMYLMSLRLNSNNKEPHIERITIIR